MGKDVNRNFTEADINMANKYMKSCSTLLFISEMQIKITMNYHGIPTKMTQ